MSQIILTDAAGAPKRSYNAQLGTKVYFWHNPRTQHILSGAPPRWDVMRPAGYQTIECNHAYEVESWSRRLNEQEKRLNEMKEVDRLEYEKPMIADLKRELTGQLRSLEKNKNKAAAAGILRLNLRKLENYEKNFFSRYDSFMHIEGFEHGQ